MKKKKWKIRGIAMACLFLAGCQNMGSEPISEASSQQMETQENEKEEQVSTESKNQDAAQNETAEEETTKQEISASGEESVEQENDQQLKNGDLIQISLGGQVQINAVVEMPDKKWDSYETCVAKVDGFQGENVLQELLGKMPEEGLEIQEGIEGEPDLCYSYEGNLGEKLRNQNGKVRTSSSLNVETEEGKKVYENLPIGYFGEKISIVGGEQNVSIEREEEVIVQCKEFIQQICGLEKVSLQDTYKFSYEQMKKQNEESAQAVESGESLKQQKIQTYEWSEEDNSMMLIFQSELNGVPVLCNRVNRQDELYIPSCKIIAVATKNGIEYLDVEHHYDIQKKETAILAEKDVIIGTLKNKYEMTLDDPITLDQMKLIYYPMTTGRNEDEYWMCDMIPTWQFRYNIEEFTDYIYINALNGHEIVG